MYNEESAARDVQRRIHFQCRRLDSFGPGELVDYFRYNQRRRKAVISYRQESVKTDKNVVQQIGPSRQVAGRVARGYTL